MSKGAKIAIVLLVLLNAFTLFFLWKSTIQHPVNVQPARPEKYMQKRLSLTDAQLQKLEEIRSRHFANVEPLEEALRAVRNELFMTRTLNPDSAEVQLDLIKIGALQQSIDSLTYAHFVQIRLICTPQQVKHLGRMMQDMTQRRFGRKRPSRQRMRRKPNRD